ncbi:HNH endonuclease family protein [Rugosimonospora acidiphila]|uniref:HNH endonuclease family protein n=1 Tax=Rugosimonospora acidiphila TaxID=556531 RepID=UPI003CD08A79
MRGRLLATLLAAVAAIGVLELAVPTPAGATPPGIPSAATARSELATLTVAAWTHTTTYNRDLFPTWDTISGTCDTRETVLKRDGTGVATNSACTATSGTWHSPYDGATWTAASDVDIDHVVTLKNAWVSGAWAWTTSKRESFANDLTDPQLIAVTDNINESKGDKSPDAWKPPLTSYYCTYARMWVRSKYVWALTVTSAEKTALTSMLGTC